MADLREVLTEALVHLRAVNTVLERLLVTPPADVAPTGEGQRYYCNKCGSFPNALHHNRPDGTQCPYIARDPAGAMAKKPYRPSVILAYEQRDPIDWGEVDEELLQIVCRTIALGTRPHNASEQSEVISELRALLRKVSGYDQA